MVNHTVYGIFVIPLSDSGNSYHCGAAPNFFPTMAAASNRLKNIAITVKQSLQKISSFAPGIAQNDRVKTIANQPINKIN